MRLTKHLLIRSWALVITRSDNGIVPVLFAVVFGAIRVCVFLILIIRIPIVALYCLVTLHTAIGTGLATHSPGHVRYNPP